MYVYDEYDQRIIEDRVKQFRDQTRRYLAGELSEEEFRGYCRGNAIKYLSRAGKKTPDPKQDYEKAQWYLNKLVEVTE